MKERMMHIPHRMAKSALHTGREVIPPHPKKWKHSHEVLQWYSNVHMLGAWALLGLGVISLAATSTYWATAFAAASGVSYVHSKAARAIAHRANRGH